ncbi:hypothetical protein HLB03_08145, partial [Acidianus sp. DSM 29099]|nr:hypothetical protein [Acidianus sp. RZ1]
RGGFEGNIEECIYVLYVNVNMNISKKEVKGIIALLINNYSSEKYNYLAEREIEREI